MKEESRDAETSSVATSRCIWTRDEQGYTNISKYEADWHAADRTQVIDKLSACPHSLSTWHLHSPTSAIRHFTTRSARRNPTEDLSKWSGTWIYVSGHISTSAWMSRADPLRTAKQELWWLKIRRLKWTLRGVYRNRSATMDLEIVGICQTPWTRWKLLKAEQRTQNDARYWEESSLEQLRSTVVRNCWRHAADLEQASPVIPVIFRDWNTYIIILESYSKYYDQGSYHQDIEQCTKRHKRSKSSNLSLQEVNLVYTSSLLRPKSCDGRGLWRYSGS